MPAVKTKDAVAARETITNLWAQAEMLGELHWRVPTKHHAYLIRNKLYAHRALLRRQAYAHTGISTCSLDEFKLTYSFNPEDSHWHMAITRKDVVDLEFLMPKEPKPAPLIDEIVITHKGTDE